MIAIQQKAELNERKEIVVDNVVKIVVRLVEIQPLESIFISSSDSKLVACNIWDTLTVFGLHQRCAMYSLRRKVDHNDIFLDCREVDNFLV